jgi:hypothetical protein
MDLQAVKVFINVWTGSLKSDIMDMKDFHEAIVNTRNGLHGELNLIF